MDDFEIIQHI